MNFIGSERLHGLLSVRNLLVIAPLFLLTVKHWISAVTIIASVAAIVYLLRHPTQLRSAIHSDRRRAILAVSLTLAGPLLAVLLGQLLRQEFLPKEINAPLRIALCVPIFLAVCSGWLNTTPAKPTVTQTWMETVMPVAAFWTLVFCLIHPSHWGDRLATYFVDPLSLGALSILFSLMAATTIFVLRPPSTLRCGLLLAAFLLGLYLSILTGSRTGWPTLPVLAIFCGIYWARPRYGMLTTATVLACGAVFSVALIAWLAPSFYAHISTGVTELTNYQWNSVNPNNQSVTDRISMYRMGGIYFTMHPLTGWGELGWMSAMNAPEISAFATEETKLWPRQGFHNEVITSAVRSGLWGLLSSALQFLVPAALAAAYWRSGIEKTRAVAAFVFVFSLHYIFFGMTTEVTGLIFLASFFGLTLAVSLGELLQSSDIMKSISD